MRQSVPFGSLHSRRQPGMHYGSIWGTDGFIDEVVVSLYRAPRSYTGEDMIEISCHGSGYVMGRLLELFIEQGARAAQAGEFTIRAFLAGKLDLSQAEAVADMIASSDRASHALASTQMRGGYSHELAVLREQLLGLAALLELELDFSEEDVEFADRSQLMRTIDELDIKIYALAETFRLGNAIKEGIPVAITGPPNAGKSTLLNALLNEERAMVSDIEGTTRDTIEESVNIGGLRFRFIDTAGIRETGDRLERMGIERTYDSAAKADVVLYLVEAEDVVRLVGGAAGDGACGVACGVAGSGPDDVACGVACGVAEDVEAVDEIVSEAASNAVPEAVPKAVADAAPKAVADAVALASLISIAEHIYRLKLREDQRLCLIVNKIDSYSAPEKIAGMEQLLKDTLNCILQNCPDGLGDKGRLRISARIPTIIPTIILILILTIGLSIIFARISTT